MKKCAQEAVCQIVLFHSFLFFYKPEVYTPHAKITVMYKHHLRTHGIDRLSGPKVTSFLKQLQLRLVKTYAFHQQHELLTLHAAYFETHLVSPSLPPNPAFTHFNELADSTKL